MPAKKYFTEEEKRAGSIERQKKYRERHPERARASSNKWRKNHPEKARAGDMAQHFKREDEKYKRGQPTITTQWIIDNIFNSSCYYCGKTGWENLGCDRIDNSKPHTPDNVVPCCKSCNERRQDMPFAEFVAKCKEAGEIVTNRNNCRSRAVVAINDAGEIVYEFPSTAEAGRNGFNQRAVSCACRGCYNPKGNKGHRYRGLLWFYK